MSACDVTDEQDGVAQAISMLAGELIDMRSTIYALVAALGNQPALNRTRLSQDFVSTLRGIGVDPMNPSLQVHALLVQLQAKTENSPHLSIAARGMLHANRSPKRQD